MGRSYLRIGPELVDDKLADGYPPAAVAAYVCLLCEGERQSPRGRFKNLAVLRGHLGMFARWINFMLGHHDLVILVDGRYYIVGWDEWQEGDWLVAERMRRVRLRRTVGSLDTVTPTVTSVTPPTVTPPLSTVAVSTVAKTLGGEHGGLIPLPAPLVDKPVDGNGAKALTTASRGFRGGGMTKLSEHLPKVAS